MMKLMMKIMKIINWGDWDYETITDEQAKEYEY
jgi:hypothetical protein